MVENALGNTTYHKGLRYYLETAAHQSVGSDELYAGIQKSIDEDFPAVGRLDIARIMRTWEFQSGYPVITVERIGNQLNFRQERFFYTDDVSENLWWVPINFVVGSNPNFASTLPNFWMQGVPSVNITNVDYFDWIVVNIQESGYYRVNYDFYLWNLLRIHLNFYDFTDIHVLNRAQIVDDSLNLAQANRVDYGMAFGILQYLSRETDHIPWAAVNITGLKSEFYPNPYQIHFAGYSRHEPPQSLVGQHRCLCKVSIVRSANCRTASCSFRFREYSWRTQDGSIR